LLTNFTNEEPQWLKICQISNQDTENEDCQFINKVMKSTKIDTFTIESGAQGYFIRVVDGKKKKRPTILVCHGGPHSSAPFNMFLKEKLLWATLGYNLCIVNYRGSVGFGLKFLEELSGNVFEMDVNDCLDLFQKCLDDYGDEINSEKLGVYGGSHGGFLTCSIISHPNWIDRFQAACIWNPVTAMHSAICFSDIPDWHYSVACNKPHTWILEKEDIIKMYDKSPIGRLTNVKTPSLFIIGGDDRRCPGKQGLYFWKGLRARGVESDLHYYPTEGHAVASLEEHMDAVMNMVRWWVDHI